MMYESICDTSWTQGHLQPKSIVILALCDSFNVLLLILATKGHHWDRKLHSVPWASWQYDKPGTSEMHICVYRGHVRLRIPNHCGRVTSEKDVVISSHSVSTFFLLSSTVIVIYCFYTSLDYLIVRFIITWKEKDKYIVREKQLSVKTWWRVTLNLSN